MAERETRAAAEASRRAGEDSSSSGSGWRRAVGGAADEIVWRAARRSALRGVRRAEPVAVKRALAEGKSILAIAADGLPGLLAALPAIRALRRVRQETRLDLLSGGWAGELVARDGLVDHVLAQYPLPPLWQWRSFRRVAAAVASRNYEVVFSFDHRGERATALLAHMTGARLRVSVGEESNHPFFNVHIVPRTSESYLPRRNLALLGTLGVDVTGMNHFWELPECEKEVAERLLQVKQLKGKQPLVAFDPRWGVGETPEDVFPLDWLAEAVMRKTGARGILLSESVQCELPPGGLPHGETRELGLSGLREALGVLSRCDGFVGRNTGFFHLAVALRVPAVGLISPHVPRCWQPEEGPRVLLLDATASAEETAARAAEYLGSLWSAPPRGGRS